ncbi:MAG: DUF485 domain-containing protein [Chthoniobacteraceae bacterium]
MIPQDPTPIVGSQTDVAPLGRTQSPTAHEAPAGQTPSIPWDQIAEEADFKKLVASKAAFIAPVSIFFLLYYFALPVLVGWYPDLMKTKIGSVNYAYLFALSQFFMAWVVALFYVAKAVHWDKAAAALVSKFDR